MVRVAAIVLVLAAAAPAAASARPLANDASARCVPGQVKRVRAGAPPLAVMQSAYDAMAKARARHDAAEVRRLLGTGLYVHLSGGTRVRVVVNAGAGVAYVRAVKGSGSYWVDCVWLR